jgi:hypothetical protein
VIPKQLQDDIDYLHGKCGAIEWSGLLIYEVTEGHIGAPKDLVLTVKGIYLFDIGHAAYTEFEVGEEIIEVYEEFPELMEEPEKYKYGKIHSHHNMKAYHSATDVTDLHEQAPSHAFYVSLVVNFDGKYDCEIAVLAKQEDTYLTHKDGKGGEVRSVIAGTEKLIRIQTKIVRPEPELPTPSKVVSDRFEGVLKAANERSKALAVRATKTGVNMPSYSPNQLDMFDDGLPFGWEDDIEGWNRSFGGNADVFHLEESQVVAFLKNLLFNEPGSIKEDTIDGVIAVIETRSGSLSKETRDAMIKSIENNVPAACRETFKMQVDPAMLADTCMFVSDCLDSSEVASEFACEVSAMLMEKAVYICEALDIQQS